MCSWRYLLALQHRASSAVEVSCWPVNINAHFAHWCSRRESPLEICTGLSRQKCSKLSLAPVWAFLQNYCVGRWQLGPGSGGGGGGGRDVKVLCTLLVLEEAVAVLSCYWHIHGIPRNKTYIWVVFFKVKYLNTNKITFPCSLHLHAEHSLVLIES